MNIIYCLFQTCNVTEITRFIGWLRLHRQVNSEEGGLGGDTLQCRNR